MTYSDISQARPVSDPVPRPRVAGARVDTLDLPVVPVPRRRRPTGTVAAVLLAAAVAGLVTGAVVAQPEVAGPVAAAGDSADSATAVIEATSVESFDPSGGSGFQASDSDTGESGAWRTQTYRTAEFGNLKPGVGLLMDLGAERQMTSVTLDGTQGLAVQLRASDEPSRDVDAYRVVDAEDSASGTTTLSAQDAGAHRYWLVWVTRLAPTEGGYAATIGTPVLEGR